MAYCTISDHESMNKAGYSSCPVCGGSTKIPDYGQAKEKDLPKAVWSGSFNIFGVEIKCHVLDDGQRVIEADSIAALLKAWEEPDCPVPTEAELMNFAKWTKGTLSRGF